MVWQVRLPYPHRHTSNFRPGCSGVTGIIDRSPFVRRRIGLRSSTRPRVRPVVRIRNTGLENVSAGNTVRRANLAAQVGVRTFCVLCFEERKDSRRGCQNAHGSHVIRRFFGSTSLEDLHCGALKSTSFPAHVFFCALPIFSSQIHGRATLKSQAQVTNTRT